MKLIIGLLALLLVLPTTLEGKPKDKSKIIPVDWKLTGSLIHLTEGSIIEGNLKGKPGSATGRGISVGLPVTYDGLPVGHACADLDSVAGGSGVIALEAQFVMTFKDGSMLWGERDPDIDFVSYACYSGYAYARYLIVGGHKRFEGATGFIDFELEVLSNFFPPIVAAEIGWGTGEIILP